MKIKIHDDNKGDIYSFEASLDDDRINITAFGDTKEEAIENLKTDIFELIDRLKNVNYYNTIKVDCFGKEIK